MNFKIVVLHIKLLYTLISKLSLSNQIKKEIKIKSHEVFNNQKSDKCTARGQNQTPKGQSKGKSCLTVLKTKKFEKITLLAIIITVD